MPPDTTLPQTVPAKGPLASYPYDPQPAVLPKYTPVEPTWTGRNPPLLAVGLVVLAAGASFNFLIPFPVAAIRPEPSWIISMAFAGFAAELAAFCSVLVFAETRFWLRLLLTWVGIYSLMFAFIFGIYVVERPQNMSEPIRVFFGSLPIIALAVQLPLWTMRLYLGWRIGRPAELASERRLSIGDIFSGTIVAALTAAAFRSMPIGQLVTDQTVFWIGWAIAIPALAIISLLAIVPTAYLMLRLEQQVVAAGVVLGYAAVVASAMLGLWAYFSRRTLTLEIGTNCVLAIGMWTLVALGLLSLVRWLGYRLIFPRDYWTALPNSGA